MASNKKDFKNISFKVTEKEFDPDVLEKIKTFFNAQKSKQVTIGLMTQFFIDNVGYMDLSSYEGVKLLTQSKLARIDPPGTPPAESSVTMIASHPDHQETEAAVLPKKANKPAEIQPAEIQHKPAEQNQQNKIDDSPGRDDF
ncbi:hypothetical protein [Paenibacillus bovis]|uniref:Uncharacterized protein n=1 Tax=Paenibacillus bovis TaxID=1616788 RepID=A0A1X9T482_9BACL|nr:hypothetical protein [Paenibacillus bovis]ARR10704.1 hypothetical protein AR543_p0096 [Paenibacillus bovis]